MLKFENLIVENLNTKSYITWKMFEQAVSNVEGSVLHLFGSVKNAKESFRDILLLFENLPDPILIYRLITATSVKEIDLKSPGTSWTFTKEVLSYVKDAIAITKYPGQKYFLLSGTIEKRYVDWQETLNKYMEYSFNQPDWAEDEIYVNYDSEVKNIKIELYDAKV